jgi:hypothetical protein
MDRVLGNVLGEIIDFGGSIVGSFIIDEISRSIRHHSGYEFQLKMKIVLFQLY